MKNDLMSFFAKDSLDANDRLQKKQINSLSYGVKKRTGEKFIRASLDDGRTYIRTLSQSGINEQRQIQIPPYTTKAERDNIVMDLLDKYVQSDVADFMGLSQGTISNIKRKYKK